MSADETARHKERAQKHKAAVDAKIAAAQEDKGLLLVLTGNGKGKSSSAFGMMAHTLGSEYIRGFGIFGSNPSGCQRNALWHDRDTKCFMDDRLPKGTPGWVIPIANNRTIPQHLGRANVHACQAD